MLDGVDAPSETRTQTDMPSFHHDGDAPRLKILLVDDNPESLIAIEAVLAADDREIVTVMSGEEALKRLLENDFCLILLDVKMPGLDGYETAALIRARERTRDIPIIFLTSYGKVDVDVVKGYAHGAVDYIVKPVVPEILQSKVHVFMELAKRSRELKRKNEALERAESELMKTKAAESLIKHAPDPVFVSDLNANILLANDAASDMLGLRVDELGHETLLRFLSPDDRVQLTSALREVVKKGISRNVQLRPRSASGKVTPTMLNASAWRDPDGRIIGAIGILRDMTEYARMLQDLQESRSQLQDKIHDLEKFEEVVVGRELKMIELEKEIDRLRAKAGE